MPMLKIREVKNKCSICRKYFVSKIVPDKTYQGGNCFYSLDPKDKTEEWECDNCWGIELVKVQSESLNQVTT